MKHLLILFFVLVYTLGTSQNNSIGPTVGYNHSWVSFDNTEAKPGFNVGVVYNNSFMEHWGAGVEVKFSSEGFKNKLNDATGILNYIRVPLRLQYFFGNYGQAFRPKIFAGPSIAFLLNSKSKIGDQKIDTKGINSFDIGALGGVGFNYRIAKVTWLNFDLAYTHGLLDIYTSSAEAKNRNINVNLGVAFGF